MPALRRTAAAARFAAAKIRENVSEQTRFEQKQRVPSPRQTQLVAVAVAAAAAPVPEPV